MVMWISRPAENMMGVLICRQVVLLNDGRADSPVECSSGWVGCGMTVWGKPLPSFSSFSPLVLLQWMSLGLTENLFPSVCARRRLAFLTCTSSYLAPSCLLNPPDMWGDNERTIRAKWPGVNTFGFFFFAWALVSPCHIFITHMPIIDRAADSFVSATIKKLAENKNIWLTSWIAVNQWLRSHLSWDPGVMV